MLTSSLMIIYSIPSISNDLIQLLNGNPNAGCMDRKTCVKLNVSTPTREGIFVPVLSQYLNFHQIMSWSLLSKMI